MEIKRRFLQDHSQLQDKVKGEADVDKTQISVDKEIESGIPSRKSIHSKPQKKSTKLTLGYSLSLVAILLVLGGSGWWMKSQISHDATEVTIPEVKKLEPNKEMQKQADISKQAPEVQNTVKTEQAPKIIPNQPPTGISQPSQTGEVTKSVKPQKPEAKPVYKKIMKHKVGAGETLYRISVKYYHTGRYAAFLGKYNRIHDPSNLISGTYVKIPFPPGK